MNLRLTLSECEPVLLPYYFTNLLPNLRNQFFFSIPSEFLLSLCSIKLAVLISWHWVNQDSSVFFNIGDYWMTPFIYKVLAHLAKVNELPVVIKYIHGQFSVIPCLHVFKRWITLLPLYHSYKWREEQHIVLENGEGWKNGAKARETRGIIQNLNWRMTDLLKVF